MNTAKQTRQPESAPLYGLEPYIALQGEAAAAQRGVELSARLATPGKSLDLATRFMHTHTPLFAGTIADPQPNLFQDPTF